MEEEAEVALPQYSNIKSMVDESWGRAVIYDFLEYELEEKGSTLSVQSLMEDGIKDRSGSLDITPMETTHDHAVKTTVDSSDYRLSFFDCTMMAVILETTVMQMQILNHCNNALMVQKAEMEMEDMERARFGVPQTPESKTLLIHSLTAAEMTQDRFKLEKFENDRKMATNLLQQTLMELLEKRSFTELESALRHFTEERQLLASTENENAALKLYCKGLNRDLHQRRARQKTAVFDADLLAAEIEDKLEDAALNADIQCRYAERWEVARTEQANLEAANAEECPTKSLELSKRGVDNEQRINGEIELAYSIAIEDGLRKIEEWMEKYENDSEGIDLKLRMRKSDYQNALDERMALEKELEKRGKLMADWIKFKTNRQSRLDFEAKMKKSAVSIQSWWRGMLVRKCLGPYKPKKGKKPGGKEDKKKKK